jgi:hypothetical protein
MKTKIYILGLAATILVFLGIFFKIQHWPGTGYLFFIGLSTLVLVFLPVALWSNYISEGKKENVLLYIVTYLTCLIVFTAMLFKIQHWSGAGILLIVSVPFPFAVFLPLFLYVTGKNKNHNIYNTIAVLFLLILISSFSALLSLSVSKERIADSFGIAVNYNKLKILLNNIPDKAIQSPVVKKIDDVIALTEKYEDAILKLDGASLEEVFRTPEKFPELRYYKNGPTREWSGRKTQIHSKLQAELSDLIILLKNNATNKSLSGKIASIMSMEPSGSETYIWTDPLFLSDIQPWILAYLERLRTSLIMIKYTL